MYNMYLKTGNFKSMRKALTVGELLITMAIIGVIAMLVLPGFLKDYHNRLYTTRLNKSYEITLKFQKKLQEQHLLILIEPFQMLKIMMVNQSQVT